MQCNLKNRNQTIKDYLIGKLAAAEREAFDEHLFNCDVCYRELRLQEEMIETIKKEGALIFSEQIAAQRRHAGDKGKSFLRTIFPTATRRPALAFAALVSLVVISGLVIKQMKRTPGASEGMISEKQDSVRTTPLVTNQKSTSTQKPIATTKKPAKADQLYAANFQPSPMFEEMLSSNLRSSDLNVVAPQNGRHVKSGAIHFEWQGGEAGPFQVKIVNNRGREVAAIKTDQRRVTATQKLPPGLYYWKLETEEDLLYLGTFIVPVTEKR